MTHPLSSPINPATPAGERHPQELFAIIKIHGCRSPCPHCSSWDTWCGITCYHPKFPDGKSIIRPSPVGTVTDVDHNMHRDIDSERQYPDWCPLLETPAAYASSRPLPAQSADAPAQCPHYEYRDGSYYCHCEYDETHDLAIATAAKAEVLDELKTFADKEFESGRFSMREVSEKTKAGTWPEELNPDIHYGEGHGRALMAGYFGKRIESLRSTPTTPGTKDGERYYDHDEPEECP